MFESGSWIPSAEISLNLNNYNRYFKSGLDTTTAHDVIQPANASGPEV